MSTEKLDHYQKLYSEFVDHLVNVHNYHQVFVENVGLGSGEKVRTSLAKMGNLCIDLRRASREAFKEHKENIKEHRAMLKEARARGKERKKMPGGRPKGLKNGQLNKPTQNTI